MTSPAPSDHTSASEETPTAEPNPILPRPPLTHESTITHPGYPWIRARTFIGGDVQTPHPTGGLNDNARFLNPTTIYTTREPVLYGTLSSNTPVYADELMAEPQPELSDDEDRMVRGYPFGEQMAINIQVNQTLLDMGNHRVLADVHWLWQLGTKEWALCQWEQQLKRLEEHIAKEWYNYFTEKRKIITARTQIEERFHAARVAKRFNRAYRAPWSEPQTIKWPRPEDIVPGIVAGSGSHYSKCFYCRFTDHASDLCKTPHYRCSYQWHGQCLVPANHSYYQNNLPLMCPYCGNHERHVSGYWDHIDPEMNDTGAVLYEDSAPK